MKKEMTMMLLTTTIIGLTAGIFYCWSVSVTKGLALLPDKEYITAFQALNRAILNPLFFFCFFGSIILLPVSTWQAWQSQVPARFWLLLSASVVYIVGVMGVTMAGNVPLNESLDVFDITKATIAEIAQKRLGFEGPWNNLNTIRTITSIVSFVLTVAAGLKPVS